MEWLSLFGHRWKSERKTRRLITRILVPSSGRNWLVQQWLSESYSEGQLLNKPEKLKGSANRKGKMMTGEPRSNKPTIKFCL